MIDQTEPLRETFADVAALIPRYSWEIMDEGQRDDLMARVVLPRYMKTTADGVELGPTEWAKMVGASARAIESRVYRLRQQASQKTTEGMPAIREDPTKQAMRRHARQVLREAPPEQIAEMLNEPEIRAKVSRAQDIIQRTREESAKAKEREALGGDVQDDLEITQHLRDTEYLLIKARGDLAGFLRRTNELGVGNTPDRWRESCLDWLDDLNTKIDLARALLGGQDIDAGLARLLEEEGR